MAASYKVKSRILEFTLYEISRQVLDFNRIPGQWTQWNLDSGFQS